MRSIPTLAMFVTLTCVSVAPAVAASAADTALEYARKHKQQLGLTAADLRDVVVSSEVKSRHNGVTHVYLQQRHRGVEVHTGILTVNVAANGKVLSIGNRFVGNLAAAARGQNPLQTARQAAAAAAAHLNLRPSQPFTVLRSVTASASTLSDGGIAVRPIEAKLVWLPTAGRIRLAWSLEIEERSGDHWWIAFVDAETGASLGAHDLIIHDSAQAIADAIARPNFSSLVAPDFAPTDGASYNVFPLPFESPSDGDRSLVSNAADPAASPFGWHDTDGAAGAEFTITRGNNAHAYADRDANNQPDLGSDPDGGASLLFDFTLDLESRPLDSQPAMVTNLFYWNNIMHDVTYGYGFDEASGNFQQTNYTGIGSGRRLRARRGAGRQRAQQRQLRHRRRGHSAAHADVRVALVAAQPDRGPRAVADRWHLLRPDGRLRGEPVQHRPDQRGGGVCRSWLRSSLPSWAAARSV